MTKAAAVSAFSLVCAWSPQECARYLETFKARKRQPESASVSQNQPASARISQHQLVLPIISQRQPSSLDVSKQTSSLHLLRRHQASSRVSWGPTPALAAP